MSWSGALARLAVLALLAAAPLFLGNFRTFLLTEILVFGLFAASLDLLIGYAGLPSLGHAAYLGVGAYAAGLLAVHQTDNAFAQIGVAVGAAAAAAVVTGLIAVRSRGIYFLMLTLAFGQLLFQLAVNWNAVTGGTNGLSMAVPKLYPGDEDLLASIDHLYFYALIAFVLGYAVLRAVVASPFGRALQAIRENEARMSSLGYNVPLYKLAAFTVAGAVAGYAGALTAQQAKFVSPSAVSFEVSALAVVALIVGGQRSLLGPVLGAAFVYLVRDELADLFSQHWGMLLGAIFVLVVYLLPRGVVGAGRAARRWSRARLRLSPAKGTT
jgi:branched-chain amino acid transport system permease protein